MRDKYLSDMLHDYSRVAEYYGISEYVLFYQFTKAQLS